MCKEKINEMEFIKREYELLRFLTSVENEISEEILRKMETIRTEVLSNEEALKYAINITKDMIGVKQLNGPVTVSFMLLELEKINSEISDKLINNLLFEYQDDNEEIPFILTGKIIFETSYLIYLLLNSDYKLDEKYSTRIGECVTQSIEKEFDSLLLTLYFRRDDISIDHKKIVIDSLGEEVLYKLINEWEENFIKDMISSFNPDSPDLSDDDLEDFEKEFENMHKGNGSSFADVINLINQKVYS